MEYPTQSSDPSGSHHRSYRERQQDSYNYATHNQSSSSESTSRDLPAEPPTAANLHDPGRETFNVDPDVPYIEANPGEAEQAQNDQEWSPKSAKRFVGGFFVGLKNAMARDRRGEMSGTGGTRQQRRNYTQRANHPEQRIPQNTYAQPGYDIYAFQRAPPATIQFVTSNGVPIGPPQPLRPRQYYRAPRDLQRSQPVPYLPQDNPDAATGARTVDTHGDGDTTVVSHDETHIHTAPVHAQEQIIVPPPGNIGSPVLMEPRPASDYAKMSSPSPPASFMSFNTHLRRISDFFRAVNSLPWVAEERVTVDYIPKAARSQISGFTRKDSRGPSGHGGSSNSSEFAASVSSRRKIRPRPRPLMSWYGGRNTSERQEIDLLSGSSSPSQPTVEPYPTLAYAFSAQAEQQAGAAAPAPGVPPNPQTPQPDLTRSMAADIRSNRGENGNVDVDMEARLASNTHDGSAWPPTYPHGYVAYQPQMTTGMQNEAVHYIPMVQAQNAPVTYVMSAPSAG